MSRLARMYICDRTELCILVDAETPSEALERFDELVQRDPDWRNSADILGGTVRVDRIELDVVTDGEDVQ